MKIKDLTVEKLERILQNTEYRVSENDFYFNRHTLSYKDKKKVEFAESLNGIDGIANLFEDLTEEFDRIPSQKEFLIRSAELIKKWWKKQKDFPAWDDITAKTLLNRQARGYKSQLNELHTFLQIKELLKDEAVVFQNDYIDLVMGVDIVVLDRKTNKEILIHIFKDSKFSYEAYKSKENRGFYKKNDGSWTKFKRNFTRHVDLSYTDKNSSKNRMINGTPVFKKSFLENKIREFRNNEKIGTPIKNVPEVEKFKNWLLEEKIIDNTYKFI